MDRISPRWLSLAASAALLASSAAPAAGASPRDAGRPAAFEPARHASQPEGEETRTLAGGSAWSSARVADPLTLVPTCTPDSQTLCLGDDGRFRVSVAWEDFSGGTGVGHAMPLFGDSGSFWFFRPDNVELTVKVIDGREVNGHFWVFFGSLSNVAFTLRVTDTGSGVSIPYVNPGGRFASVADTTAFPGEPESCGGLAGFPCGPGEICDLEPGSCLVADVGGVCREQPEVCPLVFDPVCGCDGVTYSNDCFRLTVGVTKAFDGRCEEGDGLP